MKAYKGFDENLKCREFQYEIGKDYEEQRALLCKYGFHACENPLDVFNFYSPAKNRFCEVEIDDVSPERDNDGSKICGKKIHIGLEIGLLGLINAGVKFILEKVDFETSKTTNTGNHSAATNTGHHSAATNTGYQSAATNTGDQSAATNTGYYSAATNTGDHSAATNTGDHSAATNTGYYSAATNTGDHSAATNTGNHSVATIEGKESIAISIGIEGKAKGAVGCWLVLAEWKLNSADEWHRINVKSAKVTGKTIKADTFYRLVNGKFVEA